MHLIEVFKVVQYAIMHRAGKVKPVFSAIYRIDWVFFRKLAIRIETANRLKMVQFLHVLNFRYSSND